MEQQNRDFADPKTIINLLPQGEFLDYIGPEAQDSRIEDQGESKPHDLIERVYTNPCNDWSTVLPLNAKNDQNMDNIHPISGFVYKHETVLYDKGTDTEARLSNQKLNFGKGGKSKDILDEKEKYVLPDVLPDYEERRSKDEPKILQNLLGIDNFDNYDHKNWDARRGVTNERTPESDSDTSNNTELIKDLLDTSERLDTSKQGNQELARLTGNHGQKSLLDSTLDGIVTTAKFLLVSATSVIDKAVEKVSDTLADMIIEDPFALPGDIPEKTFSDVLEEALYSSEEKNLKSEIIVPENESRMSSAGKCGSESQNEASNDQTTITDNADNLTNAYEDVIDKLEKDHHPQINADDIKIAQSKLVS